LLVGRWEERGGVERHVGIVVLRVADRSIRMFDTRMVWDSEYVQSGELLYIGTMGMTYQRVLAIVNREELRWKGAIEDASGKDV
jgi:hypothetical protein